jgi:hypothetical protein
MLNLTGRITSFGSETATRAPQGAVWGAITGVIVGCLFSVGVEIFHLQISVLPGAENHFSRWVLMLPPIIGLLFGIAAGTFVGIGIPKFKQHPEQGRGEFEEPPGTSSGFDKFHRKPR